MSQLSSSIEERLGNFGISIGNSLTQQTQNTQKSLMEMHERLAIIDRAQENIHSLSTQVNDLQNILSNKQLRGAFGEVQLENIVKDALPQNAYQFQYTLISNTRVDCIVKMPQPPGSICIDSKFPLEDYKKFANSSNAELIFLILNSFLVQKTNSTNETFGVGTLIATPSSFPFKDGIISPIAFEAPVEVGTID